MANSVREAASALKAECVSAIEDIKALHGKKDCDRCDPLSRGVITLLRCQQARFDMETRVIRSAAVMGAFCGGTITGIALIGHYLFRG